MERYSLTIILFASFFITSSAFGQLRSRTEVQEEKVRLSYAQTRSRGTKTINEQFLKRFEIARSRAMAGQNIKEARLIETAIENLKKENDYIDKTEALRRGRVPLEVIVESLNDGSDELHISKNGFHWVNLSMAKAGRHMGLDEYTYINGAEWSPNWEENRKDRGNDASSTFRMEMIPEFVQYELLAIGNHRGAEGIEERSPTSGRYEVDDDRYILSIPDGQGGSRWYRFRFFYTDLIDFSLGLDFKDMNFDEHDAYFNTRATGLLRLNQAHITDLEKIKKAYIDLESNLDKAEGVARTIERLKKENTILSKQEE